MKKVTFLFLLFAWIMCGGCTNQSNMGYVPVSGEGKIYYEEKGGG